VKKEYLTREKDQEKRILEKRKRSREEDMIESKVFV
jgi:hypothetical protein